MELSLLKALLGHISLYFRLSSGDSINSEVVLKYHQKGEEILKLLKPVLDAIVDSEIAYQEKLDKAFEDLSHSVDKLRDLFENWKPLSSKVYFVLQSEALISKIQKSTLDTFQILQSLHEYLPVKLSSTSVELCIQKIKHMGNEQTFIIIKDALRNQVEGVEPSAEALLKIAEPLNLRSNEGILIEAVALEKLKEKAEQAENAGEVEYIDQIISIVTLLHEHLIVIDQSQITSSVLIPADFCCPLSLKLMTDPVIVSSGQTYERAFIKRWIDLGLNVCPKTRQTLSHTNLIPNYTVKALIANWCELNNVKLPDPTKPIIINNVSLESKNQSMGSPGNKVNSSSGSTTHQEGPSPSDDSLTTITANGSGSDITTVSQKNSGEILPGSEDKSGHSAPSRTNLQEISGVQLDLPQNHNKTSSASSVVSDSGGFPRGNLGDNNEAYSSDNSGEVRSESPLNTTPLTAPQREPEYSPRLMEARTRTHSIWRRPSERYVPKIVSSSASETRPDLSGIETQVKGLVEDLKSDSDETLLAATAEIRLLAKHSMDNRIVIANCAAINFLVDLLRSNISKIQENAVTALLNLSINDNNKTAIAQANAIEPLIHVLETGSPEAKENSAATLFSLSMIEDNKAKIGRSGAIGPLVDLLGNGTPRGKKDAATALFNLSIFHENKSRIVEAGAVKYLVELMDPAAGIVDKVVAALANLSTVPEGRTAIGEEGGIPVLVEVVELGSSRSKENAAAALLQLCTTSNRFCNMVLQEGAVPPLVALSQSGTPRAKEKAQALLSFFRNHRQQGNAGRG